MFRQPRFDSGIELFHTKTFLLYLSHEISPALALLLLSGVERDSRAGLNVLFQHRDFESIKGCLLACLVRIKCLAASDIV